MSLYMFVLVLGCRYTCVEAINCPQLRPHLTLKYILSAYMCMCVSVCALMMYVNVTCTHHGSRTILWHHFSHSIFEADSGDHCQTDSIYQVNSWPSILFFIFLSIYFYFVSLSILPSCVCVSGALKSQAIRFGWRVTGVCELPHRCWEANLGLLQEWQGLSFAEPSLQSPVPSVLCLRQDSALVI